MLGLPFAFAHHFSAGNTVPALELYRSSFQPSAVLDRPYAMIGVSAVAADTSERALRLARSGGLSMLRLRRGAPQPVPTPEEAENHPYSPIERDFLDDYLSKVVLGDAGEVRHGLEDLRKRTEADELMITTMVHDPRRPDPFLRAGRPGLRPHPGALTATADPQEGRSARVCADKRHDLHGNCTGCRYPPDT
ncbi:hypothetical protein GCM10017559_80220 [Streptosporangium longisporum]|uniref:Luciferase-like domain-containing protein n=2 Tax=Streptosporangium longisporum TaxID=46187 RepID=A0ABP6LF55_9ACTN